MLQFVACPGVLGQPTTLLGMSNNRVDQDFLTGLGRVVGRLLTKECGGQNEGDA